jgi:hypothetical protein
LAGEPRGGEVRVAVDCRCERPIRVRGEETCLKCGKRAVAKPEAGSTAELAKVIALHADGHRPGRSTPRRPR